MIDKHIIHQGMKSADFHDGCKLSFHVMTVAHDGDDTEVIDDTKKWKKPVELILGKQFKLEVWESCLRTMAIGEVASFFINKSLVSSYPVVSKTLRQAFNSSDKQKEPKPHHCCGMGFKEGLGHPDLDKLMKKPKDLTFTFELLEVESVGSYEKEFWAMTEEERLQSIPDLKQEGNKLYVQGRTEEAAKKYSEALGRLEQLQLREKPNDEDWTRLNVMKVPLLLNYSQCQLLLNEPYSAVEHCTSVLEIEPDNVKALFRRGKALAMVFSVEEARRDLEKVVSLDPSLQSSVQKLLHDLSHEEREKNVSDRKVYKNMFG